MNKTEFDQSIWDWKDQNMRGTDEYSDGLERIYKNRIAALESELAETRKRLWSAEKALKEDSCDIEELQGELAEAQRLLADAQSDAEHADSELQYARQFIPESDKEDKYVEVIERLRSQLSATEQELEFRTAKMYLMHKELKALKEASAPVEWKPGDEGDYFGHDPINGWFLCVLSKSGKIEVWDHLREEMLEYGHIDDMEGYKFYRAILPEVGDGGES